MSGLEDLGGFLQPWGFCDSMNIKIKWMGASHLIEVVSNV